MNITEDMREDCRFLVQTLNRTAGGDREAARIAWTDLAEAGWVDVFARISGTWQQFDDRGKPTERMSFRKQAALLQTCGVFKATQVLAALDVWVASADGAFPPDPAALYGLIAGRSKDPVQNAKPGCRPESRPEVLALVADLLGRGVEDACECSPRPSGVNYVMDDRSVIYCPVCAGIESGQAYEADLHVSPWDDGRDEPRDVGGGVVAAVAGGEARPARSGGSGVNDPDLLRDMQADADPAGPQCRADLDDLEDAVMVALRAAGVDRRLAVRRVRGFLSALDDAGYRVVRS